MPESMIRGDRGSNSTSLLSHCESILENNEMEDGDGDDRDEEEEQEERNRSGAGAGLLHVCRKIK